MYKALKNETIQSKTRLISHTPNTHDNILLLKLTVTEYARLVETEGF
jgi:hypothetical protein